MGLQANELRIGNLVQTNVLASFADKAILLAEGIQKVATGEMDVYPVDITSEYLERKGFIWNTSMKFDCYYTIGDYKKICFLFRDGHGRGAISCLLQEWKSIINFPNIKYCHQLQNLFFAITSNELEDAQK